MTIPVNEAQAKLFELIQAAKNGQSVTLTENDEPVAQLVPARRFGTLKDHIQILDPDWDRPQNDVEAWLEGDV